MKIDAALITVARTQFHAALLAGPLTVDDKGVPSIADKDSKNSVLLAQGLTEAIGRAVTQVKGHGQGAGQAFEELVGQFLRETFLRLGHLRPGKWEILSPSSGKLRRIINFAQYDHLARLAMRVKQDPDLAALLGGDYLISPDVVAVRTAEPDEVINSNERIVDSRAARHALLRASNFEIAPRILHASISCKWTLRSDRAQNARSEALNLVRNRKGRLPHIIAVTAEPLPSRLKSLAMGISDLDCVYHVALEELRQTLELSEKKSIKDQRDDFDLLVNGRRLRDLSDLPLDLAL